MGNGCDSSSPSPGAAGGEQPAPDFRAQGMAAASDAMTSINGVTRAPAYTARFPALKNSQ